MEAFITSIGSILSIVLLIILGYILKEKNWFSDSFSGNISKLIMNIALPASIFVSVLKYLTLKSLLSLTGALVYTFFICNNWIYFCIYTCKNFKCSSWKKRDFHKYCCQCKYNFYRTSFKILPYLEMRVCHIFWFIMLQIQFQLGHLERY